MLKKTSGPFAYINIFKRYSEDISSNYEKEKMPGNTLMGRVGNTLKLWVFLKESSKKYLKNYLFIVYAFCCYLYMKVLIKKKKDTV